MHVPPPPVDMVMPESANLWFTIFLLIPLLAVVCLGIRLWIRDREPVLILCLVGGALAMALEPVVDVLGLVYFPRQNSWVIFETLGRPIPLFMVFVYSWYVGGQGFLAWWTLHRGATRRDVIRLYGLFALADALVETPGLAALVYTYYGRQAFDFWGFPLWWAAVNAAIPIVLGALIYRLRPQLRGWKVVALVALVPMADGAVNGAVAWPAWVTLNTGMAAPATWAAGAVTIALTSFLVWIVTLATATAALAPSVSKGGGSEPPWSTGEPTSASPVP